MLFNGGRLTSYTAAGALAGGIGGAGIAAGSLIPAQLMLFVVANGLMILLGLHLAGVGSTMLALESTGAKLWRAARPLTARLPSGDSAGGRFAAGLAWAMKIITDPVHDIKMYYKSPFYLLRGEWIDPMDHVRTSVH